MTDSDLWATYQTVWMWLVDKGGEVLLTVAKMSKEQSLPWREDFQGLGGLQITWSNAGDEVIFWGPVLHAAFLTVWSRTSSKQ
jgi:hypothetical protein